MTELVSLSIAQARDGLKQKKFSAVELAGAHLDAIEKARSLNAYVLETPERADAMAKAADARLHRGDAGPLAGIPLAIKDMFCTEKNFVKAQVALDWMNNCIKNYRKPYSLGFCQRNETYFCAVMPDSDACPKK